MFTVSPVRMGVILVDHQSTISSYVKYKVWNKITYPFNGRSFQIWEWISNLIALFIGHVIIYTFRDQI